MRALALVPALVAVAAPGMSAAQVMQPAEAKTSTREVARRSGEAFGKCLARNWGRVWRPLLEEPFGDARSVKRHDDAMQENCVERGTRKIAFTVNIVRGLVYEWLYRDDFGKVAAIDSFEGAPAVAYPFADAPESGVLEKYRQAMELGECIARHSPAGARALILSDVETDEESAAVSSLMPAFGACVDEGSQIRITRTVVRGAVAEPLYRLSKAKAGK